MTQHLSPDAWLANLPEPIDHAFANLETQNNLEAANEAVVDSSTAVVDSSANAATPRVSPAVAVAAVATLGAATLLSKSARAVTPSVTFAQIPGSGDTKILNYALALEALEADLYRQAAAQLTARGLSANDPANLDLRYYQQFGLSETGHRDFLDGVLGSASLLRSAPFNGASFDFGFNSLPADLPSARAYIAEVVLDAERTGVAAYLGALPSISSRQNRQIAAAIQGVEARHTSAVFIMINRLSRNNLIPTRPTRNVAPVVQGTSSPANNDITPQGRESTVDPLGGQTTITRGQPGVFVAQPTQSATPDNVLDKVSPFIIFG